MNTRVSSRGSGDAREIEGAPHQSSLDSPAPSSADHNHIELFLLGHLYDNVGCLADPHLSRGWIRSSTRKCTELTQARNSRCGADCVLLLVGGVFLHCSVQGPGRDDCWKQHSGRRNEKLHLCRLQPRTSVGNVCDKEQS